MSKKTFVYIDTLLGVGVFLLTTVVYALTSEPTASLWDCPEFVTSGYKLEIGHPPGAPFYMLLANLFSQFASSPTQVAYMVNLLSAFLSAGCVSFLFLTITHLARKLIVSSEQYTLQRVVLVESCGLVGALAYAFSDTFWFSATEAEVYAFSSFLTALVFWSMLKWEDEANTFGADRWVVFIAYILGISIGVHLLCLLCIPAMVLIFCYHHMSHINAWRMILVLAFSALLVGGILYILIPGSLWMAGMLELFLVNRLGLPYHSGLLSFVFVLTLLLALSICYSRRRVVRTSLLCLSMLLLGYSCYGVILIRSCANPPMNENGPDNVFTLQSYLAREQYDDAPLLYGPAYTSQIDYERRGDYLVAKTKQGAPVYQRSADASQHRYEKVSNRVDVCYAENMWFPRMHCSRHAKGYESWMGGVKKKGNLPTQWENLRFFLTYQVNFMYWRYFLWNFVGRQNDIQGHGEAEHGNWITGIAPLDNLLLGCDTKLMPESLRRNPGRNVYYGLPLILGLLGLFWQIQKGREGQAQMAVVTLLFLMTGLAIVVYLNQYTNQPRERDYAYAGSFYAFSIWIGLGVAAVYRLLVQSRLPRRLSAWIAPLLCLCVPLQMVGQTWDDHDRSGRTSCRDFGLNYLESLSHKGNPVILTMGDNDTFPLWYCQEVEGERTDVRVCNLNYAGADWYIDQMKCPAYDSPALPFDWDKRLYRMGSRDRIPIRSELKQQVNKLYAEHPDEMAQILGQNPFELNAVLTHWVKSDKADMQCVPTDSVSLISGENIPPMTLSLAEKDALYKNDLLVLEMLSHANWERPLYVSVSMNLDEIPYLRPYLIQEGLAYRVSPYAQGQDSLDVERTYNLVMHQFRYGGLSHPGVYADESTLRLAYTHQLVMSRLIDALLEKNDTQRAMKVAQKWEQVFPSCNVPHTEQSLSLVRAYYAANHVEKANALLSELARESDEWLAWLSTIRAGRLPASAYSIYRHLNLLRQSLVLAQQYNCNSIIQSYSSKFMLYVQKFKKH